MCRSSGRRFSARRAISPDRPRKRDRSRARRAAHEHRRPSARAESVGIGQARCDRRAAVWLLLGPCLLYLAAFAIYPLIYSLRLSFTDLTAADGTGRWVGLEELRRSAGRPAVLERHHEQRDHGRRRRRDPGRARRRRWRCSSICISGARAIVRGILVLPMLITPIIVGVMWRALLNPDWGLVNWAITAARASSRRTGWARSRWR